MARTRRENGYRDGKGTMTYNDGSKYVGDFMHGKRHGPGSMTYNNGDVYTGVWEHGKYKTRCPTEDELYLQNVQKGTWVSTYHRRDSYGAVIKNEKGVVSRKNKKRLYRGTKKVKGVAAWHQEHAKRTGGTH